MQRVRSIRRCKGASWGANRGPRLKPCVWERKRCGRSQAKQSASWVGKPSQWMMHCAGRSRGSRRIIMPKVAIVAALEREVKGLIRNWSRIEREFDGRRFAFFERDGLVVVCGGIGAECARRATEAVIALYHPARVESVGFAGALDKTLRIGDVFRPAEVIDARDGSRFETGPGDVQGDGRLVTFMVVAGAEQKAKLAQAYQARAVDMEAAAVFAAACA